MGDGKKNLCSVSLGKLGSVDYMSLLQDFSVPVMEQSALCISRSGWLSGSSGRHLKGTNVPQTCGIRIPRSEIQVTIVLQDLQVDF